MHISLCLTDTTGRFRGNVLNNAVSITVKRGIYKLSHIMDIDSTILATIVLTNLRYPVRFNGYLSSKDVAKTSNYSPCLPIDVNAVNR